MNWLGKILEKLVKESKKSREWRTFVFCLAAVVVFTTTYSLILPAITVETNTTDSVGGLVMEEADLESTGAGAEASGDVVTVDAENEPSDTVESPVAPEENVADTASAPTSVKGSSVQTQSVYEETNDREEVEEYRQPYNGEVQTYGDRRFMYFTGDEFDVMVSGDLSVDVPDGTILSVRGIPDQTVVRSYSDRISEELLKLYVDRKTTEILYQLVFTDKDQYEYTPTGYFDVEFYFHRNTVDHSKDLVYAAIYNYLTDEMILAEKNGDVYETPVIYLDEYGAISSINLKGINFNEISDIITLVAGPVNEKLKLEAEKAAAGTESEPTSEKEDEESGSDKDKTTDSKTESGSNKDKTTDSKTESGSNKDKTTDSKTESGSDKDKTTDSKTESGSDKDKTTDSKTESGGDKDKTTDSKTESGSDKDKSTDSKTESDSDKDKAADSKTKYESGILTARGSDYTVTLAYGADAKIPGNAALEVKEIDNSSSEYKRYLAQAKAAMGLDKDQVLPKEQARFFDIRIMADGKEVQPSANVSVNIAYDQPVVEVASNAEAQVDASAVHFGKEGAEVVEVSEADANRVEFEAESFSVYGVIYTVDFTVVDPENTIEQVGETYTLQGGSSVSLKELLVALNVTSADEADEYINTTIASVSFTVPEAVKIEKEEHVVNAGFLGIGKQVSTNDYIITPLQLFEGDEYLIIEKNDGQKTYIKMDACGVEKVTADIASISAADGRIMPADASASAEVITGTDAIAAREAVKNYVAEQKDNRGVIASIVDLFTGNDGDNENKNAYKVFDISLENVKEENYEEGFSVEINLPEDVYGTDYVLYHIHEGVIDELAVEVSDGKASFTTDGFSQFVLKYTVDFETIDGGVYSIPGGSSIALSDLLRAIGLDISVEDIKNVEFSDPALLEVSKVAEDTFIEIAGENGEIEGGTTTYVVCAGDWLLTSLKAFSTSEILTVTVSDGTKYVINVTDAQLTSNLSDLLTAVSIEIDGQQVEDGSSITVEQGQRFDVHLVFKENDFLQMDKTTLTYTLPEGITLGDRAFSKKVDVSLGQDGIVRNNTLQYDPVSNTLNFTWNKRDPRYARMLAADNTQLIFDLTGQFTSDATHVEFENGYDVTVEQTERKEADVTKNGQVYFPGDPGNPFDVPAIKYTVTVNSTGQTTVNVVDTVEGSAVTLQTTKSNNNGADGGWTATRSIGTQIITPIFTDKGFTLNNQPLQDGEEVTITYWGKVDTSGIENLTNASYQQTGNKVRVTGEGIPDKEVTHFEHEVGKNKLNKSATGVEEVDENGMQIVHWKIVLNDPPLESIGGTTLTDRIASASLQYMDYNTTGIHVVAKTASGGEKMNQNVSWEDPSLTLTQSNDDKHWVYNIPQTDEALIYEITYDTIVDTKKYNNGNGGYFSVVNESEGKPGKGTGTATVGKPEGDTPPPDITYSKKAVDVNENTITWNIPVNVKAGEYTPFKVEDKIPTMTYGSIGYTDDIESITVNGLEGDEWYATSYLYNNTNDAYAATGNNVKPSHVILTFYKDGAVAGDVDNSNEQNSTAHPGLKATSDRIINIQIVTKNNQDWLELGREHYKEPTTTDHTNTIRVNEFNPESDTAKPLKKSVMKLRDGNHNVFGSGEATAFKKVSTPGTEESPHGVVENNSQIKYPAYKFWVLVGGITDSNLENGNQIIITDVFNENLRLMIDQGVEADKAPMVYGTSDTGSKGTPLQLDPSESQTFTWSQSDGQATFILTNPPKNGDTYYPYYLVEYWLVPKSEENLASIRELAMESDGTALLENTATSDNISDELDFTYDYSVIDKRSERVPGDTALDKYTIEINKDMLTLNNGVMMELTDTYSSNLSIDFGTIEVTAEQKNGNGTTTEYLDPETGTYKPIKNLITWDFRQNVGTFTIPDATHVTITYYARPIGAPGSIQTVTNTAYMEGYYDTETQDRMVDMSGKGSAEVIRIRLLKFGADHMESGLNGAVFRLLDQDKNPLKNFTTAETGYVTRYGTLHAGHDPLDYDTNDQGDYVAPVQMYQLTPEAQHAINEGTKKLTITDDDFGEIETWDEYIAENPDALVTYEDIAENYLIFFLQFQ